MALILSIDQYKWNRIDQTNTDSICHRHCYLNSTNLLSVGDKLDTKFNQSGVIE